MLIWTQWIKPIHRCTKGQKSAYIIVKFTTTESANQSIQDGLIIAAKNMGKKDEMGTMKMSKMPEVQHTTHDSKV